MKGFHCWTDAEVQQFEMAHPVGTRARLAMALGLYLGQARQDCIAMGRQHLGLDEETGGEVLNWIRLKTEDKTGLELAIPVHPELHRIIDATPSRHLTFLVNEYDKPFTPEGFGGWFRNKCNEAGLPRCSFHGLRKAAATRLADAGCNAMEIASITGHASLREVQRYTETRDRKKAARRAMSKLKTETEFANSVTRLAKKGKKS
jgi:integrase